MSGHFRCILFFASFALAACNRNGGTARQSPPHETSSTNVAAKTATHYSFDHTQADHARTPCQSCHQRNDAKLLSPSRPYHDACVQCHSKENYLSAAQGAPFCQTCHPGEGVLDASQATRLKVFSVALRQFGVAPFSHRAHRDRSCQTCHGEVDTEPAIVPAHKECYSCHVHSAGQRLGRCEDCHASNDASMLFMREPGAGALDYNFRHSTHRKKKDGTDIACAECHAIVPKEPRPLTSDISRIATGPGEQHKSQCWGMCHVQKSEPVCGKCHVQGTPRAGTSG